MDDGESHLFLTINSKRQLAPPPQTGIFHIYGMCHELGHIAMYGRLKSLIGLPEGVGEGWAYYAGSAVVDEVACRLGQGIWPELYDVAAIEGIARLREQVEGKEWAELDAASRAAKAFYEVEKRHGRRILASALKRSLSESPSCKELMNLFVQSLRELVNDSNAVNWIPREVLVPETKWNVSERRADESFFADASALLDETGITLYYGDGTPDGRWSITGAGHAVLFRRPEGEWLLDRIDVFGSRYGSEEPPDEDFTIFLCDEGFELLCELLRPYGFIERGDDKWHKIPIDPVGVPQRFYVCLYFNPTYTKGIYVAYDQDVGRSHSRLALPYTFVNDVEGKYDWMIRVHLRRR